MHKSLGLRMDTDLIDRIDAARGDVPRSRFIARAVEAALTHERFRDPPIEASPAAAASAVHVPSDPPAWQAAEATPVVPKPAPVSPRASARPTNAQIAARSGHHEGCRCLTCHDLSTGRTPLA